MLNCDAAKGATLLQKLIAERPADLAMRGLAERLLSTPKSKSIVGAATDEPTE
jgi:hypothetical protein